MSPDPFLLSELWQWNTMNWTHSDQISANAIPAVAASSHSKPLIPIQQAIEKEWEKKLFKSLKNVGLGLVELWVCSHFFSSLSLSFAVIRLEGTRMLGGLLAFGHDASQDQRPSWSEDNLQFVCRLLNNPTKARPIVPAHCSFMSYVNVCVDSSATKKAAETKRNLILRLFCLQLSCLLSACAVQLACLDRLIDRAHTNGQTYVPLYVYAFTCCLSLRNRDSLRT